MGSTIETARRFGRLDKNGKTYVAWFSTTYESNCWPHEPDESCFTFGTIEDIAYLLAGATSDAHSGMLRRPRGSFTVAGFISACEKALRTPFKLADRGVTLKVGTGFSDAISPGHLNEYRERMIYGGFAKEFLELQASGKTSFMLHDKPELVALLTRRSMESHVPAWRVISCAGWGETLGEPMRLPSAQPEKVELWRIPTESSIRALLGRLGDGTTLVGSDYDVLHRIIARCEEIEERQPGVGLATIKSVNKAAKGKLPRAPDDAEIIIDIRDMLTKSWSEDSINRFLAKLPTGSDIERGYHRTTVGRMREQNASIEFFDAYPFSERIRASFPAPSPEPDLLSAA